MRRPWPSHRQHHIISSLITAFLYLNTNSTTNAKCATLALCSASCPLLPEALYLPADLLQVMAGGGSDGDSYSLPVGAIFVFNRECVSA